MKCKIFTVAALVTVAAALYGQTRSITATKAYVDRRYADATNAVPSIVTNEVTVGWSEWSYRCSVPEIQAAFEAAPPTDVDCRWDDGAGAYLWHFSPIPIPAGWVYWPEWIFGTPDASELKISSFVSGATRVDIFATRERFTRNALGLAMLKDLEQLPTYEAVTNTARDVVNTVWDAKLGVAWEARMYDGHLYYIAVTNAPGGAE